MYLYIFIGKSENGSDSRYKGTSTSPGSSTRSESPEVLTVPGIYTFVQSNDYLVMFFGMLVHLVLLYVTCLFSHVSESPVTSEASTVNATLPGLTIRSMDPILISGRWPSMDCLTP